MWALHRTGTRAGTSNSGTRGHESRRLVPHRQSSQRAAMRKSARASICRTAAAADNKHPKISEQYAARGGTQEMQRAPCTWTRVFCYSGEVLVLNEIPWEPDGPQAAPHSAGATRANARSGHRLSLGHGLHTVTGFADQDHIDRIFCRSSTTCTTSTSAVGRARSASATRHEQQAGGRRREGPLRGGVRNWHAKIYLRWLISRPLTRGTLPAGPRGRTDRSRHAAASSSRMAKPSLVDDSEMSNKLGGVGPF